MRILIVQRSLAPPGGGNAVAAWMVHALCGSHEVGTLTLRPWSVAATNAFYGTSIPDGAVTQHFVSPPWRWLAGLPEARLSRLRMASVYGGSRALASQYDLMITAEYYAAFAAPGIQYVQFPARLRPDPEYMTAIVNAYFALCERVLGAPWSEAARNLTLANSQWTAAGLQRLGELPNPIVLYPPVLDPGEGWPWAEREDTFLCIGRFDASKRIATAMSIVAGVRAHGLPRAKLVIVGSPVDRAYADRIRRAAAGHGAWIEFRENLSRAELNHLLGQSRFGIQAMVDEHFGMATAEMTRAGCVVFAHDSGGTREVLNADRRLLWSTEADAIQRIAALVSDAAAVDDVRSRLRAHSEQFSTENFAARFRELVRLAHARPREAGPSGQATEFGIGQ